MSETLAPIRERSTLSLHKLGVFCGLAAAVGLGSAEAPTKLVNAGFSPFIISLGMVMGVCVYHVAHRTFGNILSNLGQNTELPQFTQALYDARELAMARMQKEAEALSAEGIVGVQLDQRNHSWGSHTTEFIAIGTAVRPIRPDHEIARPQLVLSLDR